MIEVRIIEQIEDSGTQAIIEKSFETMKQARKYIKKYKPIARDSKVSWYIQEPDEENVLH